MDKSRPQSRSVPFTHLIHALDDGSGLVSVRAVLDIIAEAERVCPEDYGFEEWIKALEKRDGHFAHGYLQALVSLLLQTMTPIGPMRDRKDYPPELQDAINYLHGRVTPASENLAYIPPPADANGKRPRLFYWEDAEDCWCPAEGLEVDNIISVDRFLSDGDIEEIRFKREDMTDAEFDAIPEG